MGGYKHKLIFAFEHIGAFSYDRAKPLLAVLAVLTFVLSAGITHLKLDVSNEALLHEDDPIRQAFDQFRADFSGDYLVVVAIPTEGRLSPKTLEQLHQIQTKIESGVPYLKRTISLINARHTLTKKDELYVESLMEGWPNYKWDLIELEKYAKDQPNFINHIISKDSRYISILVELHPKFIGKVSESRVDFLTQQDLNKSIQVLKDILNSHPNIEYSLTGAPVLNEALSRITIRDSAITSVIAGLSCIAFLALFFRRVSGIILPLLIVNLAIISTIGIMGYLGDPYTLMTTALVPLMFAVGIANSVHILTHFYSYYGETGNKRLSIISALGFSAPAVLLTSVTTAIGFISFYLGDIASIADMGIYSAIAVGFAFIFTLILLPILIAIFPIKQITNSVRVDGWLNKILCAMANFSCKYHITICIFSLITLIGAGFGATLLSFSHDNVAILSDDEPEKKDLYTLDKAYDGLSTIEVVIDTKKPRGLFDDGVIQKLIKAEERLSNTAIAGMALGESYSVLNIIRETNRALNNNTESSYKIPSNTELIAQELLMFEMSNARDLREVIDSDYRYVRLTLKAHYADSVDFDTLIHAIKNKLSTIFESDQVVVTGSTAIVASIILKSLTTMIKSYAFAIILITLFMAILIGSIKVGIISMIPNFLPILLVLNFMIFQGWSIDLTTIMVGAIALGIVVDDTLHILFHYQSFYEKTKDATQAIKQTFTTTGRALMITSIIYSCAALTNTLGSMANIVIFGITLGMITLLALLIDLIVLPAFLFWLYKDKKPK